MQIETMKYHYNADQALTCGSMVIYIWYNKGFVPPLAKSHLSPWEGHNQASI